MIDIKRLHELEKEVQNIHDKILKQSWLVHHIIGRDVNAAINILIQALSVGI